MAYQFEDEQRVRWVDGFGLCEVDSVDVTEDGRELHVWLVDRAGRELLWRWSPCRPPGQQQRITVVVSR